MRKLLLVTGLLLSGALLTGGPASAAQLGCECVKLGASPVCVASISQCVSGIGGLCVAPCDYTPPKMVKRHYKPRKMTKKPAPKAMKKPAKKKTM